MPNNLWTSNLTFFYNKPRRKKRNLNRRFDFPKDKGYQTYSAIYVPSTQDVGKKISKTQHNKRITQVSNFMTKKFGGTTVVCGTGTYTTNNGKKIVREKVAIVENYSPFPDWKKKDQDVQKFVQNKAKQWGQESIGVEFESAKKPRRIVFVSAKKQKQVVHHVRRRARPRKKYNYQRRGYVLFPAVKFNRL